MEPNTFTRFLIIHLLGVYWGFQFDYYYYYYYYYYYHFFW